MPLDPTPSLDCWDYGPLGRDEEVTAGISDASLVIGTFGSRTRGSIAPVQSSCNS